MIGVVLCGGQSSRMGKDKGLINQGNKSWAQKVRENFATMGITSVISINVRQLEKYRNHFKEKDLIIDDEELNVRGPLLGLLSVHQKFPSKDLLVLACDLIQMNIEVLHMLTDKRPTSQEDALVFKGDQIEPLCGIYAATGLQKIYRSVVDGTLAKFSMMHILEKLKTEYLPIKPEWRSAFKNFNEGSDI